MEHARQTSGITMINRESITDSDIFQDKALFCCLVTIQGDEVGKLFSIRNSSLLMGRSHKCDVTLNQQFVSRLHCRIVVSNEGPYIVDLGSTNGTYVNGRRVSSQPIENGDRIKVGESRFLFLAGEEADRELENELATCNSVDNLVIEFNRSSVTKELERELYRLKRYGRQLCLAVLRIDQLDGVLNERGSQSRDRLLAQFRALALTSLNTDESLYNIAPATFALVLPSLNYQQAAEQLEQLVNLIGSSMFDLDDEPLQLSVSSALVEADASVATAEDLLRSVLDKLDA
ncbi:MAG: FHA domain-containing protein [Candidatus Alcyoniella australis]|nr:FHA domain-containing protein [Candidatus Alcyoniella australis]